MNEEETNEVFENTITKESDENITNTVIINNRIDEIAYNTGIISNSALFLVAFIVVIVVCYLLWKSLDNFISY